MSPQKVGRPALKREVVQHVIEHYGLPLQRACRLMKQARSVQYYRSVKDPKVALRRRMRELAQVRVRYGHRRLHVLLKREGWQLGRNQTCRLYCKEQLQLRSKRPKRRKMAVSRVSRITPRSADEAWSMDFVADQLADGSKFRSLTIVDNGSEFTGLLLDLWAYYHQTNIDFSRPGTPTDNSYIETFNGSFRDECLNIHWFASMAEAQATIEAWRRDYNENRPHMALDDMTPAAFARQNGDAGRKPNLQNAKN